MPREAPVAVVRELASHGYNADREAVTLLAATDDIEAAVERVVDAAPDDAAKLDVDHVRVTLTDDPSVSTGTDRSHSVDSEVAAPPETKGSNAADGPGGGVGGRAGDETDEAGSGTHGAGGGVGGSAGDVTAGAGGGADGASGGTDGGAGTGTERTDDGRTRRSPVVPDIAKDMTGRSTGTGEYGDFVATFRDRYDRLGGKLRGRVNHRPAEAIAEMPGGEDVAMVGMLNDVRSTASGHWLLELEDPSGTFPFLVMKDREFAGLVDELLLDEVLAIEGTLADDSGIAFADAVHFPDVPRTYSPSTADRRVQAALVSDVHVGSQEFRPEAWERFAEWLHTDAAATVEYLLVAGDMVEGVGVYPGQDEDLSVVDVYDQYERFSEYLKLVPGDVEVVLIPGNHDAVRLAEPQPAFDEELRSIMSAHDARVTSNPSVVTLEGVDVLMYHGVSLDELIAEFPDDRASYERPHQAMAQLLKKRHLAPQYGGRMRIAPEERDYLVVDDVPDVLHAGHVHKLGVGTYHNVRVVNSGTWQSQTGFQQSVDLEPDVGVAPILDLDTLDVTVRKFV